MQNFFRNLQERYMRFMTGRNGLDMYGQFLVMFGVVLELVWVFIRSSFLMLLADVVFIYALFRIFSRNLAKRSNENQSFLVIKNWGKHLWKACASNMKDKDHKYFVCPNCHQIVRVPRGRGQIDITCPTCQKEFSRKS